MAQPAREHAAAAVDHLSDRGFDAQASAGKVLVLASNGYTNTSMGGGAKLFRLQQLGLAGVFTDGGCVTSRNWPDMTSPPTARVRQHAGAATW